ncbi:MAG: hypothetical protein PVI23_11025 [Maricaulaceae bacterium]|jgi:hypothetical protein
MATVYDDSGLRARAHTFGAPLRNLFWMIAFVAGVGAITYSVRSVVEEAFLASIYINSVIVAVLVIGILYTLVQVLDVFGAVSWVKRYQSSSRVTDGLVDRAPYPVKPMAELLRDTPSDRRLSSASSRSILDSVGSRLAEAGEMTRYFRTLLIFLGLFGTFWGLMQTLLGVVGVVEQLAAQTSGDAAIGELFAQLISPLEGMSIAFSSSILGIGGSLVLGFLELQANQAQGRFYNDLEDWLAKISRIGVDVGEGGSGAFANALLEQLTESVDALVSVTRKVEDSRARSSDTLGALAQELSSLNDRLARQDDALSTLRERAADDSFLRHLRSIDSTLAAFANDQSVERESVMRDLKTELRALAKTIDAAMTRAGRGDRG